MTNDAKLASAFRAMRQMGISSSVVEPVLEKLLKLCEGNWDHIEADNYQLLADSIFEEPVEGDYKDAYDGVAEPSPKRRQMGHDKDKVSSIDQKDNRCTIATKLNPASHQNNTKMPAVSLAGPKPCSKGISNVRRTEHAKKSHTASTDLMKRGSANTHEHESARSLSHKTAEPSLRGETSVIQLDLGEQNESNSVGIRQGTCNSQLQQTVEPRFIRDIAKGLENVQISLIDETNSETLPRFFYTRNNVVYQNAYVHFSIARISDEECCSGCVTNCVRRQVPCACARETMGEFAYTPQGELKDEFLDTCISMSQNPSEKHMYYCKECPLERHKNERKPEPCKGHLLRKFIKECWTKCGCSFRCGNRVVQRGITHKLQVFVTQGGQGWGLRTLEELPKGSFVCEYVGEILTNTELYERNIRSNANERHTYPVLLDSDWGSEGILKDEEALCLDATFYGNCARFINHRCQDANLIEIPVQVETPDRHYYHVAFFTKRVINAMEELTWDYQIDFDDHDHPVKAFKCTCGSAFCRDKRSRKTGTYFTSVSGNGNYKI